jgi:hypothetical protein
MWDNPTLFFNTEYVEGQTNVLEYDHDFLAIHNLGQAYEKNSKQGHRPGAPRPDDVPGAVFSTVVKLDNSQERALKSLLKKANKVAKNHSFKVYGTVPTFFKELSSIDLDRALSEKFTVMYDEDFKDSQTATLKDWLNVANNPRHKSVTLTNGKQIGALSKEVYIAILNKKSLSHFLSVPGGVDSSQMAKDAIDGAVFYHATRILGREVLNAVTSDMGDAQNHEGLVLNDKKRFGVDMVKITGDFILGGMSSTFRKDKDDGSERVDYGKSIALVPGAYKPPHKEHLNMIKHYANVSHEVKVFVSSKSRGEKGEDQYTVTEEMAKNIWKLYIKKARLSRKVKILSSDVSPVRTSTDWIVQNKDYLNLIPGTVEIILGSSTKLDDKGVPDVEGRFDRDGIQDFLASKGITNDQVQVTEPTDPNNIYTFTVDMSATDFRTALQSQNYEAIQQFIPEEVEMNDVLRILGIPPEPEIELNPEPEVEPESEELTETKKKGVLSSILYGLVEEILNEQTEPYQIKVKTKHSKMKKRLIGKGKNKHTGGGKGHTTADVGRAESSPPIGEETNPVEFVAGKKSKEQACYDDPNCRALKNKKKVKIYMEPHMHQDSDEELEEMSMMSGGGVEIGSAPLAVAKRDNKKKKKKDTKNEQLVSDIINYLLKSGS